MESLGMVELNSIARGISAADAILKAANVSIISAQSVCPGKYIIAFHGSVASVRASLEAGVLEGGVNVVDSIIIPRIDETVVQALRGGGELAGVEALGVIETFTLAHALVCADEAVKSAEVTLMEIRLAMGLGGKAYVLITGKVSSVKSAIEAAVAKCTEDGLIAGTSIIPAPHEALSSALI